MPRKSAETLTYPSSERHTQGAFEDIPLATRFAEALLCMTGETPPAEMVEGWLSGSSEELQSWVGSRPRVPWWAQSLGVLDAARVLADTPCEGDI